MKIKFAWYDMWIGAYWDRKNKILYVCPLPMIVFEFKKPASHSGKGAGDNGRQARRFLNE